MSLRKVTVYQLACDEPDCDTTTVSAMTSLDAEYRADEAGWELSADGDGPDYCPQHKP